MLSEGDYLRVNFEKICMDIITMIISLECQRANIDSLVINEYSLFQLLRYLTLHEHNDDNDMKKAKAINYFEQRLRFEIKAFLEKDSDAIFFFLYDIE